MLKYFSICHIKRENGGVLGFGVELCGMFGFFFWFVCWVFFVLFHCPRIVQLWKKCSRRYRVA